MSDEMSSILAQALVGNDGNSMDSLSLNNLRCVHAF